VRIAVLSATLLLAACAAAPGRQAVAPTQDSAAAQAQAEAGQALDAVLQLRAAEAIDPAALAEASTRYRDAAARCLATPGCDAARIAEGALSLVGADPALHTLGEDVPAVADEGEDASPVATHLPEAARSINLLNGRELSDVIALNGPVKAAMTEWLTWMRPQLVDAWEHYQDMRHLMWPEYRKAGLPEALLFGILAKESGGKVHAVSRAGASGPLQFMPATGLRYGLGRVDGFDTRFDPQRATRANVAYLNDRFAEFNHNLELALAAYNGGEGRVGRLYARAPNKSFWDSSVYWSLPPETRDYVPMVLAAAWLFLHPEDYGLDFPEIETTPGSVVLAKDSTLNALAICIGNAGRRDGWFRALRNLNPRYMPDSRLAAGTELAVPEAAVAAYQANCVDAPLAEVAMELTSARGPAVPKAKTYVVRSGDSLHAIARRHNCTVRALAGSNDVRAPRYLIRPGQKLSLAACG
jgi:membrane-bound lytic murein transglycosylase D